MYSIQYIISYTNNAFYILVLIFFLKTPEKVVCFVQITQCRFRPDLHQIQLAAKCQKRIFLNPGIQVFHIRHSVSQSHLGPQRSHHSD